MAKKITNTQHYSDIADAIRSKLSSTDTYTPAQMAAAIESIPTGTTITDGTEVLTRNADEYATTAKHYGTKVYAKQYYNRAVTDGPWIKLTSIDFADTVTEIMPNAFNYCSALTSIDVSHITQVGSSAFQNCTSLTSLTFPALTSIGVSAFIYCTGLTDLSMPVCARYDSTLMRACTGLQTVQLGSVGHAVTWAANNAFQRCTQSGLTITVYTTGNNSNSLLTAIRAGATNATIIIKASEATTYGGTSYAAGDTIVTSTP